MPGNELGDRVHNFFAQDNASQGQHQSHVLEGNWPVPNSSFWVGGQNSEIDRAQSSYPVHAAHGSNFSESNLKPDFSRSQPLNEQQYSNGYMYGNQYSQSRQNEANFREPDTYLDQRHLLVSRGMQMHELQRISGHEQRSKADRSETSASPLSFDLFGGQQQMNHQQASMLQAFQRQQSGLNDMQQLQQQVMFRKMEELQRQHQLQQLDSRPNPTNQVHPAIKQSSGSQSSPFIGTPNSEGLCNPWTAEPGTNWLGHGSSAMQVPSSGIAFLPNLGQTQSLVGAAHQQVDQSLYGVPVSNSRGLSVSPYSPIVTERSSVPQVPTNTNSFHTNQLNRFPDKHTRQEGTSISRQNFQNETNEHVSGQSRNTGIINIGFHQQVNSLQTNVTQQDHGGRQALDTPSETSHDRFTMQASSPQNENTLDPAEEKILYGSDDNIWSAFGKLPSVSEEAGNLFESSGTSNGFPSIQSGSWSALMQSAVAEASSADTVPQEEWSGLNFHNNDRSSANQAPLLLNENVKQASSLSDGVRNSSAMGGSIQSSHVNTLSPIGLNQLRHTFHREPSEIVPTNGSQRFGKSFTGTSNWLNNRQVQNLLANESGIHGNASENALGAEKKGEALSAECPRNHTGTRPQANGWTSSAALPPGGDRGPNFLDAEKVPQNSHNNQVSLMRGQREDGGSLWKSSPLNSAAEFGTVSSMTGNHQPNKSEGDLSLHDTTAVANSSDMLAGDGVTPIAQNNYLLNQWKHSTNFQGGEGLGRMMDLVPNQNQGLWKSSDKDEAKIFDRENCGMKDNSNDSHRSNLSSQTSGGFRESGTIDAIDSRTRPPGKQRSNNQLAKKGSAPRKFQYHPMGNLDDDVAHTHGLKQLTQAQAISLQNDHFGQLKLFGQVPRNPTEKGEIPKESKHLVKEPSGGSFPGFAPGTSNLFSRPIDSSTNKASPPSQNMLELLHKVDQSGDHDSPMHLSAAQHNVSFQPPKRAHSDGSAGHLQRSQSSLSQGFGLQLGPPSQLLQTPNLSSPSQNAQSMAKDATHFSYAGSGMGEKSMLVASPLQSRQFSNEKTQKEYENDSSTGQRHPGNNNSVINVSGNCHSAFTSDTPYARSQLQNKQATSLRARAAMDQHINSSFSYSTSNYVERVSAETVLPDASNNVQKNNPPSGGPAQQSGPSDVQEIGPAGSASSGDQMRGSQHFGLPGISLQGSCSHVLRNMWTDVPIPQQTFVTQYSKGPSHFHEPSQPNILESSSCGDLGASKGGLISSKSAAVQTETAIGLYGEEQRLKESFAQLESASKIEGSLGNASSVKNPLNGSPANSASTQKDIEDFGRSLKPNTFTNEKFSLLNQMRALKNAESDPSIRFSKRIKGPEDVHDGYQEHVMAEKQSQDSFRNSLGLSSGVLPEDTRVVTFSSPSDTLQRNNLPHENVDLKDVGAVNGLHDSRRKPPADSTTVRVEHQMVSPQMAPSWFNQSGSFKKGPLLPLQNVHHAMSSRPEDTPFTPVMSSSVMDTPCVEDKPTTAPVEAQQVTGSLKSSEPTVEANEHLSSPSLLVNVASQQMILGPKKRKSATSEFLSWSKEISYCEQSSSILSVVEADWSKAVNRLPGKVEDCVDLIEDGPQMFRSKRRLILATQLMQQILCPLPTSVLSADASSECENVAYAASRVALGDACSTLSSSSNLGSPNEDIDRHAVKDKLKGGQRFVKFVEGSLGKAMELENDFMRLDKSASILDLRLECQDLEKFSIINRFAKFHGRGQNDNAETSSTGPASTAHKPCAQRYVTAVPMPKSLPDMVQCLSL